MNLFLKSILFLLIASVNLTANAQSCLENLNKANKFLEVGNLKECLSISKICSHSSNPESDRSQAYRLMSIAYLLQGNLDSARLSAENMLELNPTYKANLLKDPKSFALLLKSIVIIPRFTLGLAFSFGPNTTIPSISKGYNVADYQKTYHSGNSFQFGTSMGFYVSPKLALDLKLIVTGKKYSIDYKLTDWAVSINEKLTYLDAPLTLKYLFRPQKSLRFFVQGGIYGGYLLYSNNDFNSTFVPEAKQYSLEKINSIERRNRLNYGFTGGLGLYYKVPTGHLSLECNYYHSLNNINKTSSRYKDIELMYTYFYLDDDIRLHNLTWSVGFAYNLNYKIYRNKK